MSSPATAPNGPPTNSATARKCLLLVIGFLRRLLDIHEDLIDEVERELVTA